MSESEKEKMVARKLEVANKIRKICEDTNTSTQELALLAGLSEEQMDRIQSGSTMPSKSSLNAIAMVFSIPVEQLMPSE